MKPKYSVGEKVLLRSVRHPHLNDAYHISKILPARATSICTLTGHPYRNNAGSLVYVLAEIDEVGVWGVEHIWIESSLRKFHDPSEDSFEEMMEKLNKANVGEFV